MYTTTAAIDGMVCGMCEAHVKDTIRSHFDTKKVKASARKNQVVIVSAELIDERKLREVLDPTGYTVGAVTCEEK